MKKKHTIGRLLAGAAAIFLITHSVAAAADKVVVIPLDGGSGDTGGVRTVISTGQVWMDRNLGAKRAAIKSDDSQAYGSLYQWGRLGDGHEYRESPTTSTLSPDDVPGHGHFITVNGSASASPWDWRIGQNDSLWQGESGINNPCPAGFRLPTAMELDTERASWGSNNAVGAFDSPLRIIVAGFRNWDGILASSSGSGLCWSSTIDDIRVRTLFLNSNTAYLVSLTRAFGLSVRCIKD